MARRSHLSLPVCVTFLAFGLALIRTSIAATVHVAFPAKLPLDGCTLRLYAWTAGQDWPREIRQEKIVGDQTSIDVDLDDGDYGLDLGGVCGAGIVALRRPHFTAGRDTTITLAAVRVPCDAIIAKQAAAITRLGVRRLGPDEERWNAAARTGEADAPPDLLLTPDEPCTVMCDAEQGATKLALWQSIVPRSPKRLTFSDGAARYELAAAVAPGTPPLKDYAVYADFADTRIALTGPADAQVLLTNRDRAMVSYEIATQAGETLKFLPQCQTFSAHTTVAIGGKLTGNLLAAQLHSAPDGNAWADTLVKRAYICDPAGRHVDFLASHFDFQSDLIWNYQHFHHDDADTRPLDPKTFKSKDVHGTLTYRYGGQTLHAAVTGVDWTQVSTAQFKTDTPPVLRRQAKAYLQMAEQVRLINQTTTHRPGPKTWSIRLRGETNLAQAAIGDTAGGGRDVWMSLPFEGLEGFEPFTEPNFSGSPYIAHEELHTFGYNHGEEMSRLQSLAVEAYRRLRWKTVDTGVWPAWGD